MKFNTIKRIKGIIKFRQWDGMFNSIIIFNLKVFYTYFIFKFLKKIISNLHKNKEIP
jgi:hypothetical protein